MRGFIVIDRGHLLPLLLRRCVMRSISLIGRHRGGNSRVFFVVVVDSEPFFIRMSFSSINIELFIHIFTCVCVSRVHPRCTDLLRNNKLSTKVSPCVPFHAQSPGHRPAAHCSSSSRSYSIHRCRPEPLRPGIRLLWATVQ